MNSGRAHAVALKIPLKAVQFHNHQSLQTNQPINGIYSRKACYISESVKPSGCLTKMAIPFPELNQPQVGYPKETKEYSHEED